MTDLAWIDTALSAARPQAMGALLRYFRDLDVAEEAFQEACLRALKNWPANGPPLLCIHGVGRSWRDFMPLMPAFIPAWSVVAPDLRGHGGSARTPNRYLIRNFLADMTSLLRQLERPAVIYGHSLGAMLAALIAADCPELVVAVIAEDPPSPGFLEERMFILLAAGVREGKASPEDDEMIEVRAYGRKQLEQMIQKRIIRDGKTIAGLLYYFRFLS